MAKRADATTTTFPRTKSWSSLGSTNERLHRVESLENKLLASSVIRANLDVMGIDDIVHWCLHVHPCSAGGAIPQKSSVLR